MSMRWLVYSGWMLVVVGVAFLAGSLAAGQALFGVAMVAALGAPGLLMVRWGRATRAGTRPPAR